MAGVMAVRSFIVPVWKAFEHSFHFSLRTVVMDIRNSVILKMPYAQRRAVVAPIKR